VSLELAKKLKEAGYPQYNEEHLRFFEDTNDKIGKIITNPKSIQWFFDDSERLKQAIGEKARGIGHYSSWLKEERIIKRLSKNKKMQDFIRDNYELEVDVDTGCEKLKEK